MATDPTLNKDMYMSTRNTSPTQNATRRTTSPRILGRPSSAQRTSRQDQERQNQERQDQERQNQERVEKERIENVINTLTDEKNNLVAKLNETKDINPDNTVNGESFTMQQRLLDLKFQIAQNEAELKKYDNNVDYYKDYINNDDLTVEEKNKQNFKFIITANGNIQTVDSNNKPLLDMASANICAAMGIEGNMLANDCKNIFSVCSTNAGPACYTSLIDKLGRLGDALKYTTNITKVDPGILYTVMRNLKWPQNYTTQNSGRLTINNFETDKDKIKANLNKDFLNKLSDKAHVFDYLINVATYLNTIDALKTPAKFVDTKKIEFAIPDAQKIKNTLNNYYGLTFAPKWNTLPTNFGQLTKIVNDSQKSFIRTLAIAPRIIPGFTMQGGAVGNMPSTTFSDAIKESGENKVKYFRDTFTNLTNQLGHFNKKLDKTTSDNINKKLDELESAHKVISDKFKILDTYIKTNARYPDSRMLPNNTINTTEMKNYIDQINIDQITKPEITLIKYMEKLINVLKENPLNLKV